ncbi:MAG: dienelactone hydrolase family protein [Burkholderiaceae bacterium]
MGETTELKAADGHRFKTYRAEPSGKAVGAVVIAPEIFGVNPHIRSVADGFAADGFLVLAPALFDRAQRDYEAGYEDTDIAAGRAIIGEIEMDTALRDIDACVAAGAEAGKVGLVGYCWGGTIAWLAAARTAGLSCAVSYYGGGIAGYQNEKPAIPLMLHFGEQDTHPSLEDARKIAGDNPTAQSFFYPAGHGFNCDARGSFNPDASAQARTRTVEFFRQHL